MHPFLIQYSVKPYFTKVWDIMFSCLVIGRELTQKQRFFAPLLCARFSKALFYKALELYAWLPSDRVRGNGASVLLQIKKIYAVKSIPTRNHKCCTWIKF